MPPERPKIELIRVSNPTAKLVVHRDRDYLNDEEAEGFTLRDGEVRPDFLNRLDAVHQSVHQRNSVVSDEAHQILNVFEGKEVVELRGIEPLTLRLPA